MQKDKEKQEKKDKSEDFDFQTYRQQVIAGLMNGQPLTGESGLLKPLIADFVQGALNAELEDHLSEERSEGLSNRRNGKQSKRIRTESGDIPLSITEIGVAALNP